MLATASALVAAIALAETSVTLRLNPAAGAKYKYKATMDVSSGGGMGAQNMKGSYTQWFIVKAKKPQGTTFQIKFANVNMSGGMGDMSKMEQALEKQTVTATYSPLAAYVSGDLNAGTMGAMSAQAGLQGIIFPSAAVKAGSKWTATVDFGKMLSRAGAGNAMKVVSGGKVPVSYKITGFKTIGGKTIAGITASMNGTIVMAMGQNKMTMKLKSNGSGQLDVRTGMVRTMATTTNVTTNFGQMNIQQTVKTTLTLQ